MTRPRLRRPGQSWPLQLVLGIYEFLASLGLAVVLIGVLAVVLAGATFVESYYGDKSKAVSFGIYGTTWFAALNLLLGINVLCAALIRFPWQKKHTGFLMTHAGILVLLAGAALSQRYGIDANLPVYEGHHTWRAYEDSQHIRLVVQPTTGSGGTEILVPFVAGPFNWQEYQRLAWWPGASDRLCWFPWGLARRDQGVLYDREGIRLEVLDYHSDSEVIWLPLLRLRSDDEGSSEAVTLSVHQSNAMHGAVQKYGLGEQVTLPRGTDIAFWMTGDAAETAAFQASGPRKPVGRGGQVVLTVKGQTVTFNLDELGDGKERRLPGTNLTVANAQFEPRFLGVHLEVREPEGPPTKMVLFAALPHFNRQDYRHGIYGTFWLDPAAVGDVAGVDGKFVERLRRPRLDILQGHDQRLYYRAVHGAELEGKGILSTDRRPQVFFSGSERQTLRVVEFLPNPEPVQKIVPLPFSRNKDRGQKRPRALVRLTVDGRQEEFWISAAAGDSEEGGSDGHGGRRTVVGGERRVTASIGWDEVDIGFQVHLHRFERKLDPGTSQAWHYSSLVDFLDRRDPDRRLRSDVLITLNEPVDFSDPLTGRSYRFYQSSYNGPYKPGDPEYDQMTTGRNPPDRLFVSQLSANYDPGRGLKYVGSFLICVGIAVVFYLKAIFLRKPANH